MSKIGVVLSGCGVMDGSEIHEAVLTLLAIAQEGAEAVCMAPNVEHTEVINHLTGEKSPEKRNVLVEAARLARGNIKDIKDVQAEEIDALVFPGGYGAAKNLCTFAFDGPDCKVQPDVARLAREVHEQGKPIGVICIAPALAAKIFQGEGIELTIGSDASTAQAIEKLGQKHVVCSVSEACVDPKNRIVSTPAYMLARHVGEAYEGIRNLVSQLVRLVREPLAR